MTGALSGTDWDTFNSKLTVAGALTEGYVATIVSGVPTWAVAGGGGSSKWTDITNGIYRGGPVGIAANSSDGITALVSDVALSLKSFSSTRNTRQILRGYNNADTEVFAIDQNGAIYSSAIEGYFG